MFSFERNIEIADPNGSAVLLGSISNGDTDKARRSGRRRHRDARRHRRSSSTSTSPTTTFM